METRIYLVFPELRNSCSLFRISPPDRNSLKKAIQSLRKIFLLLEGEEESIILYDAQSVKTLYEWIDAFPASYPSIKNWIRDTIKRIPNRDWRENEPPYAVAFILRLDCETLVNHIVSGAAHRKLVSEETPVLLINISSFERIDEHLAGYCNTSGKPVRVDINHTDPQKIAEYLSSQRMTKRIFKHNPKHDISNASSMVSVLKCDEHTAEKLLQTAFGNSANIWAYDTEQCQFIEFKKECENVWHGYHLEPDKLSVRENRYNLYSWLQQILKQISCN